MYYGTICLSARSHLEELENVNSPTAWVAPDYWAPSKEFEKSSLGDAEQQLTCE